MMNGKIVSTCSGCKVDGADQTEPEDDVTVTPFVPRATGVLRCYSSDDDLSVSSEEPVIPSEDVYNKSGYDSEDMSCWDAYRADAKSRYDSEQMACWDKFWADTSSSVESESPSDESESPSVESRYLLTETCSDNELKWDSKTHRWFESI